MMIIETKEIPVNEEKIAEIDARDNGKVYIVQGEKVIMLPLPAFGTLEIPCQNYKVGNLSHKITTKI
ncbi:hypothetical protein [Desertibacillus haloalkaliphilus]|uniref:hypothetical protein n=1 Tax=Desertibacillus haloalkaliphilus TaxID=1328930 RepID=UPI001C25967E|nr:hypothetical protein [Desertibacillus haloalkaliphilus]MBU8908523.1 hypothetical protein [Desertibacillus haloalkaliphilus]